MFKTSEKTLALSTVSQERNSAILTSPLHLHGQVVFADLSSIVDYRFRLLAKIESYNAAGSIKLKPAVALVEGLRAEGRLGSGATLVDTSSGNMGVSLAMACRAIGIRFLCVTDEKITLHNRKLIEAYGGGVHVMEGSTHADRCKYIIELERSSHSYVWARQFEDRRNPMMHETTTGQEIFDCLDEVSAVFVGVGTGGTIAGCAVVRDAKSPGTRIVAVDPLGSMHFPESHAAVKRHIPGIGASERSPFLDDIYVDDVVVVSDSSTVSMCLHVLETTGWLFGGSSGSVLSAVKSYSARLPEGGVVVAICADSGERYLNTIYDPNWRRELSL